MASTAEVRRRRSFLGLLLILTVATVAIVLARLPDKKTSATGGSHSGIGSTPPPANRSGSPPASSSPGASPAGENVYAAIAPGNFSPAVAGIPARVYVPNGTLGTVEVIDPRTYRILHTYAVGAFPEHVTPSWDMRWLYVDVSASSKLVQIDPRTGLLTGRTFSVSHPYNLYFTPDGSKAVVVAEYFNRLEFRNPHTFRLIKSVPMTGCSGPDHADFTADGRYFLIGCEFDGNVFKVDAQAMRIVGKVNVGGLPVDIKLSPDGSVFYVANQGLGGVTIVDARTLRRLAFLPTGKGAHGMAVSRDTRFLYLTNRLAGTMSVINFATRKVVATWNIGGSPDMVQVTPDGRHIWVSNRYGTTVVVIDARTGRITHTIQVGADPHGLAYFPQPGNISLGHNGVYR